MQTAARDAGRVALSELLAEELRLGEAGAGAGVGEGREATASAPAATGPALPGYPGHGHVLAPAFEWGVRPGDEHEAALWRLAGLEPPAAPPAADPCGGWSGPRLRRQSADFGPLRFHPAPRRAGVDPAIARPLACAGGGTRPPTPSRAERCQTAPSQAAARRT